MPTRLAIIALLTGALTGVGVFTFHYAEGFSYFSTDPAACANCHIMQPQYDSWQKSSHHVLATCVDCHLPHQGLSKWLAKADNGYRHSKGFTLQDFPEPIQINESNLRTLQKNCMGCHGDLVHQIVFGSTSDIDAMQCIHCHRGVGHGASAGLGGPERADEQKGSLHE
jgi:cytochrome c nitrite reductase small subunit